MLKHTKQDFTSCKSLNCLPILPHNLYTIVYILQHYTIEIECTKIINKAKFCIPCNINTQKSQSICIILKDTNIQIP